MTKILVKENELNQALLAEMSQALEALKNGQIEQAIEKLDRRCNPESELVPMIEVLKRCFVVDCEKGNVLLPLDFDAEMGKGYIPMVGSGLNWAVHLSDISPIVEQLLAVSKMAADLGLVLDFDDVRS